MAIFFLAEIQKIIDNDMYRKYIEKAAPIIQKYGGEYVLRSNQITPISGDWDLKRIILIRFATKSKIQTCFQSSEYKQISHLREKSTISKAIIIEE